MLAALSHGREWESGTLAAPAAALGWCAWKAPGVASSDRTLVVLDGCIFNRSELGSSASDADAVLQLYEQCGLEVALRRVNGDFAVGLYDLESRTLWLARDRFGVRPLYYAQPPGGFAFASQPRALLTLPGVSTNENRQFAGLFAASHYRYFDNQPERSPYEDIAQLPAGHLLRVTDGGVTSKAYWRIEDRPDFERPEDELAEEYRALLLDAVAIRLRAAERPVFTLSGGMDSSSVLACAVRATGRQQAAISTVYDDRTYDESAEIRSMLDTTTSAWHPVRIGTPRVLDLVARMVEDHDEPVATATWLSHYLLCEEARRQGFGGIFGGLGGDELNAGEYEHFYFHFADLEVCGDRQRLDREVAGWVQHHDHPIYRKGQDVVRAAFTRVVDLSVPGRCLPDPVRMRRYEAAINPDYFDLRLFEPVLEHPFRSYLKNRTWQDLARETAPCCLRAEDRQTVAAGLDNFLPFFDHRLVEFMFRVPGTLKFRDGITKVLLRRAMRGVLPEETRTRVKKTGWNAPAHIWFSGSGREALLDLVHSRTFRERGIYDVPEVLRLTDEHQEIVESGRSQDNHMMFLWQLVNLELWLSTVSAGPSCSTRVPEGCREIGNAPDNLTSDTDGERNRSNRRPLPA